jgi:hypothetical protein
MVPVVKLPDSEADGHSRGVDYYGPFDRPYRDGLRRWLGASGSRERRCASDP